MRRPNFFIIGAPKCGTTAIAEWLGEHPAVFMSPLKEPHYYNTDLNNREILTRRRYDRLFRAATGSHQAIGEASVWYLYSNVAVRNILTEIPNARFVVCIRNPVDMAYSLYRQQLYSGNENITSFAEAWDAQSRRAEGGGVTRLCEDHRLLLYGAACKLGYQLERLLTCCDRRQVHIVLLDDLKHDAQSAYKEVVRFLGLCDDGRERFEVVNGARERRSPRLARAVKFVNEARRRIGAPRLGTGLMPLIDKLNCQTSRRADMEAPMRARLTSYFEEDVAQIEGIVGRRFDNWKI